MASLDTSLPRALWCQQTWLINEGGLIGGLYFLSKQLSPLSNKSLPLQVLLDSGADYNFIEDNSDKQLELPLEPVSALKMLMPLMID